jgi:hypothetical protein
MPELSDSKEVGSFGSNKIADRYMDEMITTCATLTNQEKLNEEIFKLVILFGELA